MALSLALTLIGNLIVALFVVVCTALILIILLQKGRGGGIGAAFGGGGGAGSLLGTKTGDFLTWVTITLVAGFLVLAVLMGKFMRGTDVSDELSGGILAGTETTAVDQTSNNEEIAAEETTDAAAGTVEETAEPMEEEAQPAEEPVEQAEGDAAPEPEPSN